jgi:hypothetical protein
VDEVAFENAVSKLGTLIAEQLDDIVKVPRQDLAVEDRPMTEDWSTSDLTSLAKAVDRRFKLGGQHYAFLAVEYMPEKDIFMATTRQGRRSMLAPFGVRP